MSADSAAGRTSALHKDISNVDANHKTDENIKKKTAVVMTRNASVLSHPLEFLCEVHAD